MVRSFAQTEVAPGARERDAKEEFDMKLFKRCGELGFLGVTCVFFFNCESPSCLTLFF